MNRNGGFRIPEEMLGIAYERNAFYAGAQIEHRPVHMNCETAVHYFYKRVLGIILPDDARTAELLTGHRDFFELNDRYALQPGDIVLLGHQRRSGEIAGYKAVYDDFGVLVNYIRTHMTVVINTGCDIYHCNKDGSSVRNLGDLLWRRQYQALFKIVRHRDHYYT